MNIGYIRVSSADQNEARQFVTLEKYKLDKIYSEKISGANMERPMLKEMLKSLKKGDTVYIADLSRLARSTYDLLTMIKAFEVKGINLVSDKEKLDLSTPQGKLILTVLAAVYEFEREIVKERQAEGIAIAKSQGKYKGRAKMKYDRELFIETKKRCENREITKKQFAKIMGVSIRTLYNMLAEYGQEVS